MNLIQINVEVTLYFKNIQTQMIKFRVTTYPHTQKYLVLSAMEEQTAH